MKERPILFKGDMVTAILDGRKTQTRRVLKPQPAQDGPLTWSAATHGWWGFTSARIPLTKKWRCPYGVPGDKLWVRETWRELDRDHRGLGRPCLGRDGGTHSIQYQAEFAHITKSLRRDWRAAGIKWRSALFMPRKFSRITLDVLDVRAERVQDITEQDIHAEGTRVVYPPGYAFTGPRSPFGYQAWVNLWDSINAKRGRVKRYREPEYAYWSWGSDEADDREAIALDIADAAAIRWRDPDDWECPEWATFGEAQPNGDGFYEVLWLPQDTEPRRVWLTRDRGVEGEDWTWEGGFGWDMNPWVWVVKFRSASSAPQS